MSHTTQGAINPAPGGTQIEPLEPEFICSSSTGYGSSVTAGSHSRNPADLSYFKIHLPPSSAVQVPSCIKETTDPNNYFAVSHQEGNQYPVDRLSIQALQNPHTSSPVHSSEIAGRAESYGFAPRYKLQDSGGRNLQNDLQAPLTTSANLDNPYGEDPQFPEYHQDYRDGPINYPSYHANFQQDGIGQNEGSRERCPPFERDLDSTKKGYMDDDETESDEYAGSPITPESRERVKMSTRSRGVAKRGFTQLQRVARARAMTSSLNQNKEVRRWTDSDDDKVAFLREYGKLKWHEVTEFINGRHTPQAVQMRYLRSLKRRNDGVTSSERKKLTKLVIEDYEGRFRRLSIQMGPAFTPVRIQKIFLQDAGLGALLQKDKIWSKEEIAGFLESAAGDFDKFEVPYRADQLPRKADEYMNRRATLSYKELVDMYVGRVSDRE